MKSLIAVLMTLVLACAFSGPALAKTVYFKNGDELDCVNAWKEGGRIKVLVNRDTQLDFAPGEVDLNRTFATREIRKKAGRKHGKRHGAVRPSQRKAPDKAMENTSDEQE